MAGELTAPLHYGLQESTTVYCSLHIQRLSTQHFPNSNRDSNSLNVLKIHSYIWWKFPKWS